MQSQGRITHTCRDERQHCVDDRAYAPLDDTMALPTRLKLPRIFRLFEAGAIPTNLIKMEIRLNNSFVAGSRVPRTMPFFSGNRIAHARRSE